MNATLEQTMFEHKLRTAGIPAAQDFQKRQKVYQHTFEKYRPAICKKCTTFLFCNVCSQGDWLF